MSVERVMTIGHSTRSADQFLALLRAHGVTGVADVRAIPGSRRHPHFSQDALAAFLPAQGVRYEHFRGLGEAYEDSAFQTPGDAWISRREIQIVSDAVTSLPAGSTVLDAGASRRRGDALGCRTGLSDRA